MSVRSVSTVIPTRNRPEEIQRCVPTVLATNTDRIVIVDQSQDEATQAALNDLGALRDRRVSYLASTERGVSRARNTALAACVTDIVAFTDDDCTVPPSWADEIRATMGELGYDLMFAPVAAPAERGDLVGWIPEFLPERTGLVDLRGDPISSFGYTANLAMTARVYASIGPFDEWLGPGSVHNIGGEDTDYGYRALRAGFAVGVASAPTVTHYGAKAGRSFDAARKTYQRGAGAFLDKHARLGDATALRRELLGIWLPLRQAAGNAVRLRRPSGLGDAWSFVGGVGAGRRHYRIDKGRILYVPRSRIS